MKTRTMLGAALALLTTMIVTGLPPSQAQQAALDDAKIKTLVAFHEAGLSNDELVSFIGEQPRMSQLDMLEWLNAGLKADELLAFLTCECEGPPDPEGGSSYWCQDSLTGCDSGENELPFMKFKDCENEDVWMACSFWHGDRDDALGGYDGGVCAHDGDSDWCKDNYDDMEEGDPPCTECGICYTTGCEYPGYGYKAERYEGGPSSGPTEKFLPNLDSYGAIKIDCFTPAELPDDTERIHPNFYGTDDDDWRANQSCKICVNCEGQGQQGPSEQ